MSNLKFSEYIFPLAAILFFTAVVFSGIFKNEFINWDDTLYITQNQLIRNWSFSGIKTIFSVLHFNGYLPVTQLSYAIDFLFWKENPMGYHLTNLMLHLANVVLVFFLAQKLIKNKNAALITAVLFAIHPMRVESVAWAAERKDVLYAFFYLFSMLNYSHYLQSGYKQKFFFFTLFFFVLAVLSKWSAYPLPVLLLLFDYYYDRKIRAKAILEKLLFLTVPLISVYIHIAKGNIVAEHFSIIERFFLGSYSFLFYIIKLFFPFNLSAIYPYPKIVDGLLSVKYYFSVPATIFLMAAVYLLFKKLRQNRKIILFGFGFFLINIGMVLHVLYPIGGRVVAADRYTYVAYFGLFLLAAFFTEKILMKKFRKITITILIFTVSVFSFYTFQRNKVWANSIVFFSDIIKKDSSIAFAWNNLGSAKADLGNYQGAIADYSKAIELDPDFSFAYNNRGLSYEAIGKSENALRDFTQALSIKTSDTTVLYNRALTYFKMMDYKNALKDFLYYIQLSPSNSEAYNYLGLTYNYLNLLDDAMNAYNRSLEINPFYASAYNNRGWIKFSMHDDEGAMKDFDKAIELNADFDFPYHNRGLLYFEHSQYEKACADWKTAAKLGYKNSEELIKKYCR